MKKITFMFVALCLLTGQAIAKDIRIGVVMATYDDNFLTLLRNSIESW